MEASDSISRFDSQKWTPVPVSVVSLLYEADIYMQQEGYCLVGADTPAASERMTLEKSPNPDNPGTDKIRTYLMKNKMTPRIVRF